MDDLLRVFLAETAENLDRLDAALVRLEREPDDPTLVSEIFRAVHSIKGTCGFLGLPRLAAVAHAAENVLGRFRDGSLRPTPGAVTLILETFDAIKALLAGLRRTGAEADIDHAALIARLDRAAAGDAVSVDPPAAAAADAAGPAATPAAGSVRVDTALLDEIATLTGELVLTRNRLRRLVQDDEDGPFAVPVRRLDAIVGALKDVVDRTRMQPVGHGWTGLPRLVRDLSRDLGKKIELELHGGATELDRQVLEAVRDPLVHMVRNAADHGIESPRDRLAAGKPETGRIQIAARQQGGHIVIEIADDGRGIDLAKVRARALSAGLATGAELAAMPDGRIAQFVLRAGFSTADGVTGISGRGVGMDVVRANVEAIGGHVEIASVPGRGSTVVLRMPLTLAILPALIVAAGGVRLAVPQDAVNELVRVTRGSGNRIDIVQGAPLLRLRARPLPLVALDAALGLAPPRDFSMPPGAGDEILIVVLRAGEKRFGAVVDRIDDVEQIVVKPLSGALRRIPLFAGAAILGDGGIVLLLELDALADGFADDLSPAPRCDRVLEFRRGAA